MFCDLVAEKRVFLFTALHCTLYKRFFSLKKVKKKR